MRLERVEVLAVSLKGLKERMRQARYRLESGSKAPPTREQVEVRVSTLTPGTIAHRMAAHALRRRNAEKGN